MSLCPKLRAWRAELEALHPREVLRAAAARFPGAIALSSSLGLEDQALTDMVATASLPIPIVVLDTGRMFEESYALLEETRARYRLELEVMTPERAPLEAMLRAHGPNLFRRSVALRELCCDVRKLKPLQRALAGRRAWITGLRREQSAARSEVRVLEADGDGRVKINPLWRWSATEVRAYLDERQVPINPLHDQGYPSIGCRPCTRAVVPGEHPRSGRWFWEREGPRECGLHSPKKEPRDV